MNNISKQLLKILSTEIFQSILNNDAIKIEQLLSTQRLLISAGIPFDLSFSPGTRRDDSGATLVIHVNPTTTITFTITLEAGGTIFSGI